MIITWHLLLYLLLLFDWRMRITFDTSDVYLYCFSLLYLNILYDYYHYYTQWWIATTILYDIYFHNKLSARAQRNITERKKHTYIWVLHVRKQILGFYLWPGTFWTPCFWMGLFNFELPPPLKVYLAGRSNFTMTLNKNPSNWPYSWWWWWRHGPYFAMPKAVKGRDSSNWCAVAQLPAKWTLKK